MILRYAMQYLAGAVSDLMTTAVLYGLLYIALADRILPLLNGLR
jgi:hypothetical protein